MTGLCSGYNKPKHGEPTLVKTDKNGTQYWVDANCSKCGGSGFLPGYEYIDGARCWKCEATGYFPHSYKVYTDEYAAILQKRRNEKAIKKILPIGQAI
jgi:hypothetical protein